MAETLKSQSDSSIYKAQLLSYYYSRRAESAIGRGERFGKRKLTAVCSHQTRIGNLDAHLI